MASHTDARSTWSARRFALEQKVRQRLAGPGLVARLGRSAIEASFWLRERVVPARRRARTLDRGFDAAHGTDTRGYFTLDAVAEDTDNPGDTLYEATRPSVFGAALDAVPIRAEDFVFVDLGSGKGRALLLASDRPFKKVVGVEFSKPLNDIATRNIARYVTPQSSCSDVQSLAMDATEYALPEDNLLVYMFNPFPPDVLRVVVTNIRRSVADTPRDVFLLYMHPVLIDVLDEFPLQPLEINKQFALYRV